MDYHYNKHHKTYVNNLNTFIEQAQEALARNDVKKVVELALKIKFNGGGNYNHTFFWETLAPIKNGGGEIPNKDSEL